MARKSLQGFAADVAANARKTLIARRLIVNVVAPHHDSLSGFREAWTTRLNPHVPVDINADGAWTLGANWKCVAVENEFVVGLASIALYTTSQQLVGGAPESTNLVRYDYESPALGIGRKRHIHTLQPVLGTRVHYLIPDNTAEPWDLGAVVDLYLSDAFARDLRDAGLAP